MTKRPITTSLVTLIVALLILAPASAAQTTSLYQSDFASTRYGRTPDGWHDVIDQRPSRQWAVDGNGLLRAVAKLRTGLVAYEGDLATGQSARELSDATLVAEIQKTDDDVVSIGIAARIQDRDNYYLARFGGTGRLELIKVKDGKEIALDFMQPAIDVPPRPTGLVTLTRYQDRQRWKLSLSTKKDLLTARVIDDKGAEVARMDAIDADFAKGEPGLWATRFASAASFKVESIEPIDAKVTNDQITARNKELAAKQPDYPLLKPNFKTDELNTPRNQVKGDYDIVVAGAGTGGVSAAIQAARLGARVLLLDETDWIGGQMSCAAVCSMDEDGVHGKFPVRERGIYREFNESVILYYQTLEKDPFMAYYAYPNQLEGGYEPKVARAVLYALIQDARDRKQGALDVSVRSRVVSVAKDGNTINGATIEFLDESGTSRKDVKCKILVDATEYGDVIPLTGSRYRAANTTSEKPDPKAPVQDHTWTCVLREYPGGVPDHLKIQSPPPGYEEYASKRWKNYSNSGFVLWGGAGKGIKGPRNWRVYFAWRGMADTESPLVGERSTWRHTECGFNGGNDYPVTMATLDDPDTRMKDEREGIYRSLGALYFFQQMGVPWGLAEDEGYNTTYNRWKMKQLNIRPDLQAMAASLPQQPYVRESRRIFGVKTLVAKDLTRFENAKLFPTSIAMGDYFMDLDHGGTGKFYEKDLDDDNPPTGGGPFQVPFEVFIPETLDGFLPAEKNFSQSRVANGGTRLQPITMLTGQGVGTIAAIAIKQGKQPRQVEPRNVQAVLLDSGCTLIQRWHSDVAWGTPIWRATQLLSLYQVIDRTGPITKDSKPLAAGYPWGVSDPLKPEELRAALNRIAELNKQPSPALPAISGDRVSLATMRDVLGKANPAWANATEAVAKPANPDALTAGEFALVAAKLLAP